MTVLFLLFSEANKRNTLTHKQPEQVRQKKLRTVLAAIKKISTKTYTVTYSMKKKKTTKNLKFFMVRTNACHEMSLTGKENNY